MGALEVHVPAVLAHPSFTILLAKAGTAGTNKSGVRLPAFNTTTLQGMARVLPDAFGSPVHNALVHILHLFVITPALVPCLSLCCTFVQFEQEHFACQDLTEVLWVELGRCAAGGPVKQVRVVKHYSQDAKIHSFCPVLGTKHSFPADDCGNQSSHMRKNTSAWRVA